MKNKKLNRKKVLLYVAALAVLALAILIARSFLTTIEYSNLASSDSLAYVTQHLEEAGIPTDNIETFQNQVEFTNEYLATLPTLQGDFATKRGVVRSFDGDLAFNLFIPLILPEDMNCRVAAWNLMKHTIKATPIDEEIEPAEEQILEYYPYVGFEDGDKELFWSVFKGIETSSFNTTAGFAKIIEAEWDDRNVKFTSDNISLISCFSYAYDNKWLEAVHVGVMIALDEQVLFIEKINPKAPFQASLFDNENQLKYYLQQRMLRYFILQPVIMKNDSLL